MTCHSICLAIVLSSSNFAVDEQIDIITNNISGTIKLKEIKQAGWIMIIY